MLDDICKRIVLYDLYFGLENEKRLLPNYSNEEYEYDIYKIFLGHYTEEDLEKIFNHVKEISYADELIDDINKYVGSKEAISIMQGLNENPMDIEMINQGMLNIGIIKGGLTELVTKYEKSNETINKLEQKIEGLEDYIKNNNLSNNQSTTTTTEIYHHDGNITLWYKPFKGIGGKLAEKLAKDGHVINQSDDFYEILVKFDKKDKTHRCGAIRKLNEIMTDGKLTKDGDPCKSGQITTFLKNHKNELTKKGINIPSNYT